MSIHQAEFSTKSMHKNLVCSLQMRAMDLEDQIKVICFQHTNKPVDVIKQPSQQWRSHWASLGGKINGLYSFIPCVILLLMRTEKKSFILYTVQYNRLHNTFPRPTGSERLRKSNLRREVLFIALLQQYLSTNMTTRDESSKRSKYCLCSKKCHFSVLTTGCGDMISFLSPGEDP